MSEVENTTPNVPVLTLNNGAAAQTAMAEATKVFDDLAGQPAAPDATGAVTEMLDTSLTEEEKQQVKAFAQRIDLTNPDHVMLYGADAQKKISSFSDTVLSSVKTDETGDVGDMLANLVANLEDFSAAGDKPKGLRGLFSRTKNRLKVVRAKYDEVSVNVEKIAANLEDHQVQLLKDVSTFNKLYDMNLEYMHELTMYIVAGEQRLEEVRSTTLVELQRRAAESQDAMDAQRANDLAAQCDRFEKKLYDLKLTRTVSIQMAPQIRLLQNNNALLVERIQSTLVNTLPLRKNQMVLALGMEHSRQAMQAERAVNDMTNALLKKNAETLKMGTIETAKEAERGIIDLETLKATNQSLIDTINEVTRIQTEGRAARRNAEKELTVMEQELKKKLLEMHV